MLAAIYIHTSSHIIAAPMAHYMAINSSRFLYSLDSCHLPVHAMDNYVKDQNMVMTFKKIGGKQVVFHAAMNYYYRSQKQNSTCFYEYFSDMYFMTETEAKNQGLESFEFSEDHPGHGYNTAVFRIAMDKKPCFPVFPWHWLPSTASFSTSLLEKGTENDPDYQQKEEYAYKCMLLFLPFRSHHDLKLDGSYQLRWQQSYRDGLFSESMIRFAENIQTIHNSLASSIPPNELNMETVMTEEEEERREEEKRDSSYDDLLSKIGDFFASTSQSETSLVEDTSTIDPKLTKKVLNNQVLHNKEKTVQVQMNPVIHFSETEAQKEKNKPTNETAQGRFVCEYSTLNTLALEHLYLRHEMEDQTIRNREKKTIHAKGTWQSIVHWGQNANLDPEQQTAFEILVATYVLTFYEEARADGINFDKIQATKEGLCKLARKEMESPVPLRLFVTGPAGAGKCKCK